MTDERDTWKQRAETPKVIYQDRQIIAKKCDKCDKEELQKAKSELKKKMEQLKDKEENIDWNLECKQNKLDKDYKAYKLAHVALTYLGLIYAFFRCLVDLANDKALLESIYDYIQILINDFQDQDIHLILILAWSILTVIALILLFIHYWDIFTQGFLILVLVASSALGSEIMELVGMNLVGVISLTIIGFLVFRFLLDKWRSR